MNHGVSHKYLDDCDSSGPRPPVLGQESSRLFNMTEDYRGSGAGGGTNSAGPNQPVSVSCTSAATDYRRSTVPSSSSFTTCKWNQNLTYLLEDAEGADLFKRYVENEGGIHADRLKFYFACEGLKQQTEDATIKQMVRAIYRFLRKSKLSLTEDLRAAIKNGLATEAPMDANIFNHMQMEIVHHIRETTYPNFLQSDLYCQHIDSLAQAAGGGSQMNLHQSVYREQQQPPPLFGSGPSSGSGSGCATIPRTLSTLHEDTEFSMSDCLPTVTSANSLMDGPTGTCGKEKPQFRLTRDMLLATQDRRLELRPQGAHGYISKFSSTYNPVSCQDSDRQSCSSGGGMTDSDTMSVKNSRDGRTHQRRSREHAISDQPVHMNPQTNSYMVVPLTSRIKSVRPPNTQDLLSALIPKLQDLERDQKSKERLDQIMQQSDDASSLDGSRSVGGASGSGFRTASSGSVQPGHALTDAIFKKLQPDDDNDQSILDQHVSRVWKDLTPHRSPGTVSPCPDMQRMRSHDIGIGSDVSSLGGSMRHSRSMPEHSSSRRLTNKWSSMNTDSGISMFSMDQPLMKPRESTSRTRPATSTEDTSSKTALLVEEARRRLEDESIRKTRRYAQYPPPPQVPAPVNASQEFTIAVCTFHDEPLPYRYKLTGLHPTLYQFKLNMHKKGNYRYFFKTACDDLESPVIQEEIINDTDVLPQFEGKVMALIKPYE